jgi:WG repeat protein
MLRASSYTVALVSARAAGFFVALCLGTVTFSNNAVAQTRRWLVQRQGKFGFMDAAGVVVIPASFDEARPFSEGLAAVRTGNCWTFVSETGARVQPNCFDAASSFSDSLAAVLRGDAWGFVNSNGAFAITPRFERTKEFTQRLAPVRRDGRWYYIDRTGREVLAPPGGYRDADTFSEGLAPVRTDQYFEYIDREGTTVIPARFSDAQPFSEGLAAVRERDSPFYEFIDRTGRVVIRDTFALASSFSSGRAAVLYGEFWGFIDHTGRVVLPAQYPRAGSFQGSLVAVTNPFDLTFYVDADGRVVAPQSDVPSKGFGADTMLSVRLESRPAGAEVFLIPRRAWERDTSIASDPARLLFFKVPQGPTNTNTKAREKVYVALFKLNGARRLVPLDVLPSSPNVGVADFQTTAGGSR